MRKPLGGSSSAGFRSDGPEASVNSFARSSALAVSECVHITGCMPENWVKVGFQPCTVARILGSLDGGTNVTRSGTIRLEPCRLQQISGSEVEIWPASYLTSESPRRSRARHCPPSHLARQRLGQFVHSAHCRRGYERASSSRSSA